MQSIKDVTDIEVLRQYALMMESHMGDMGKKILSLEKTLAEMAQHQEPLSRAMADELSRLKKKFFGFGREALKTDVRPVGKVGQQLTLHGGHLALENEKEKVSESNQPIPNADGEAVKSRAHQLIESGLVKLHEFSEKELSEESEIRGMNGLGHKVWAKKNNFYQDSSEVTIVERTYTKVLHRQQKYQLKDEYNTTGKEVIITAPGPAKLNEGCRYSIDFALSVVSDKYEYHLPLERQRRKMESAGLDVEVKTLYGLCEQVAIHCDSVREQIKHDIFEEFSATHLDETPWNIISSGQKGYMWVASNRRGAFYQFEPSRAGKVPKEILKNYQGAAVTDAYVGYNAVAGMSGIRLGHCWAHLRREFFERTDDFPDAVVAVEKIKEIFDLESQAKTFEELAQIRREKSKTMVTGLYEWFLETRRKYLPDDGIVKAINYALNHWSGFTLFLSDLSVPLTNNDAERALRHVVVGRKNYAGSKTINGADTAASLFTVIETCKRAGVQPREYMKYLIEERWHKREPASPVKWAINIKKITLKTDVVFPAKTDWAI